MGFEPTTFALATRCSTAELRPHIRPLSVPAASSRRATPVRGKMRLDPVPEVSGAGSRIRTHDLQLGRLSLYR
jgi:hypothetical protein